MNDEAIIPVGGELFWTFSWAAQIVAPATLASVTYVEDPLAAGGGLTLEQKTDDLANKKSSIRIKGAAHGRRYSVKAIGVSSTGETIPKELILVGMAKV